MARTPGVAITVPDDIAGAVSDVIDELAAARAEHPPMHGAHEGYAVILEELDELWDEIKRKVQNETAIRDEAVQTAAMALRFILDVCGS